MDSDYAPRSPDLSAYQPQSPDPSAAFPAGHLGPPQYQPGNQFGGPFGHAAHPYAGGPTSIPAQPQYADPSQFGMPTTRRMKQEEDDNDFLPETSAKRARTNHQPQPSLDANGFPFSNHPSPLAAPQQTVPSQPRTDPTLGVQLKTSFPVARIKRIMQADEDIGKVAQVTPHVVSRALELFMIKLISASANQARGDGRSKGPRRVLVQHMKAAVQADETFDFLAEIVKKVPDAHSKAKKEVGSDSEDGGSGAAKGGRKKGRKRKDSSDEF